MAGRNFFLDKSDPASRRALNGLALKVGEDAESAGLPKSVMELVSVRISQLNGCAFCLDLHVPAPGKPASAINSWPSCPRGGSPRCSPRPSGQH